MPADGRRLFDADEAHLTGKNRTDIHFELEGWDGNSHSKMADSSDLLSVCTNLKANVSLVGETAEGTVVFDGAIPNLNTGVLKEAIVMEVEDGAIVENEGGRAARKIAHVCEGNHPRTVCS